MNDMKLEEVVPSADIGRCNVCQSELATRVLSIDRTIEVRFCDKCFDKFRIMVAGPVNAAGLLYEIKDLHMWSKQVVTAPKDKGAKECGEFVKMCCEDALKYKERNCDTFAGDVVDAAAATFDRFCKFCEGRECSDCEVSKLRSSRMNIMRLSCFSLWCFMEKTKVKTKEKGDGRWQLGNR